MYFLDHTYVSILVFCMDNCLQSLSLSFDSDIYSAIVNFERIAIDMNGLQKKVKIVWAANTGPIQILHQKFE